MLVVNFLEIPIKGKYIPIMDSYVDIDNLIKELEKIKKLYKVKQVFLAGDSIVGSMVEKGDYVCLVAEIE